MQGAIYVPWTPNSQEDRLKEKTLPVTVRSLVPLFHESLFLRGSNRLTPNRADCRVACIVPLRAGEFVLPVL